MPDFSEFLGLNNENVSTLADTYAGYARYLAKGDTKGPEALIASSFLIAGTFYSLYDPEKARHAFSSAAEHYFRDRNPFYKIAAICGLDREILTRDSNKNESVPEKELGFGRLLTQNFLKVLDETRYHYSEPENNSYQSEQPVGRLGIPLGLYQAAFNELESVSLSKNPQSLTAWPTLLNRAAERTRLLQNDSYHWRGMKGNFLPVEPEILAASLPFSMVLNNARIPLEVLIQSRQAYSIIILPVLIARQLHDDNDEIRV